MSFFFKSKKHQSTGGALPPSSRDITSAHGQSSSAGSQIPTVNGHPAGSNSFDGTRGGSAAGQSNPVGSNSSPGASVNNSVNSIANAVTGYQPATSPEPPRAYRDRSGSEPPTQGYSGQVAQQQNGRSSALASRPPGDSPYPWSQLRLAFTQSVNPFPRYGIAVNAIASKDGSIYLMGGLVNGSVVKGDLWMVEAASGNMACYPVQTPADGPCPRVGHASLLVGNAFIVFGGDTKVEEGDVLDDTLYLLNTSTKQWSRALPSGSRPSGRYGHTLNLVDSKIYVFGGQVEGYFFNDLVAFDLNGLQSASSKWEILIPNTADSTKIPAARTNHSVVSWNGKLYLFGGTDGERWFSDVWTYDPRTNSWSELDCIGYIPAPREGHAAALVNDTMYVFGGRTREGNDLGDLAAFKIPARRWYMFQNMGPSPSPRSGHSMTTYGKQVMVLGGEPSSAPRDPGELSLAYVLDTSKIRYPATDPPQANTDRNTVNRKISGSDRAIGPVQSRPGIRDGAGSSASVQRTQESGIPAPGGSRLPRATAGNAPSGPPPQQQAPQPKTNGAVPVARSRSKTPTRGDSESDAVTVRAANDRDAKDGTSETRAIISPSGPTTSFATGPLQKATAVKDSGDRSSPNRSMSRNASGPEPADQSQSSRTNPRLVTDGGQVRSRQANDNRPIDSGLGSSPALSQQTEELTKELEAAKSRNAWYASELSLARKAGYLPNPSSNPILDERAADTFGDDDRPLLEALLKMRSELATVQGSIDSHASAAAEKIAQIEKQRDAAIEEAVYAKAKLAAHGASPSGTPQMEGSRDAGTPDIDRVNEVNRKLATTLNSQAQLAARADSLKVQLDAEMGARKLAEETAEASQRRVSELDKFREKAAAELESLRDELHESQKKARDESLRANEHEANSRLLAVDKDELAGKLSRARDDVDNHSSVLDGLHSAVTASSEKATMLETKLEEEKNHRDNVEQKLAQLRADHEQRTAELDTVTSRLRDAEELAERHAEEARSHREVVMRGFGQIRSRDVDASAGATDERVAILQQQVDSANAMVRSNQDATDLASQKLRRAEERIAGLEAYQEQTSRESLAVRKQLQTAMRELQNTQAAKAELHQTHERHQLDSNALQVQLKTLKSLLEEKGINASDQRRTRASESPAPRYGTPDHNRVRELERQLDQSRKSHDELRGTFEQREQDVSREWEAKLEALDNDHQAAVKYLRGTEKMLTKMKSELQRYKSANSDLERDLANAQATSSRNGASNAAWETERATLQRNMAEKESNAKASIVNLEAQLNSLKDQLSAAEKARDDSSKQTADLEAASQQARGDLDKLRSENLALTDRAHEAEHRVQMFLDQFETSVDNYRRESRLHTGSAPSGEGGAVGGGLGAGRAIATTGSADVNGASRTHYPHGSLSGDSIYSDTLGAGHYSDDEDDRDGASTPDAAAMSAAQATRNSIALDSLATELDALRSHWETTNKHYRLSDKFDPDGHRAQTTGTGSTSSGQGDGESPTVWRNGPRAQTTASAAAGSVDTARATPTAATAAGGVI